MSDEHQTTSGSLNLEDVHGIADYLVHLGFCELERSDNGSAFLRWAGKPRRGQWPEDVTIRMKGSDVLVSCHTGSKHARSSLLEMIKQHLATRSGRELHFEEL